jgi:tetratricopeptide (TPR) repeat protein
LLNYGKQKGDQEFIARSTSVFRHVLELQTPVGTPWYSAIIQSNISHSLSAQSDFAERTEALQMLHESLKYSDSSIEFFQKEENWRGWTNSLNNKGVSLGRLATHCEDLIEISFYLRSSINHFQLALTHLSPLDQPQEWARVKTNLAQVYLLIGRGNDGKLAKAYYQNAIQIYNEVLEIRTREAAPLKWAFIQLSLAQTRKSLGDEIGGVGAAEHYRSAVTGLESILQNFDSDEIGATRWELCTAMLESSRERLEASGKLEP